MKLVLLTSFIVLLSYPCFSQIDSTLLRQAPANSSDTLLNMDAVYNRPFLSIGRLPVSLGGYVEANWQHLGTDGVSDGHQFQMRRFTLFVASTIYDRLKFLSEIEFEDGTKEINIEFAALDIEFHPLLNMRGGIILNPIGAFNQNHDGPKWEFIDRPMSSTEMLPATWSNVGFGIYGKQSKQDFVFAYEAYLTNGFNDKIINNSDGRTSLSAAKENEERFEESFNGLPLVTLKAAVSHNKIAEIGLSYMGGVYNKFEDDGLLLNEKYRVDVFAVDMNTIIKVTGTYINTEFALIHVETPSTYSQQYGNRQHGGFLDIVQPFYKKPIWGFNESILNISCRLEYVDWNVARFKETNTNIADHVFAVVPSLSWRISSETVLRLNYRYQWQADLLGNPYSKTAGFQAGFSSYF